jgi:hypothetical protein
MNKLNRSKCVDKLWNNEKMKGKKLWPFHKNKLELLVNKGLQ